MTKFNYKLSSRNYDEFREHERWTRNMTSLCIRSDSSFGPNLIKQISSTYGSQITRLQLRNVCFENYNELHQILLDFNLLEVLRLENVDFRAVPTKSYTHSWPAMQLKELSISGKCPNLYKRLFRLLKNAQGLRTLTLSDNAYFKLFYESPRNKLMLTKLSINVAFTCTRVFDMRTINPNFILFLNSQRETLTELSINNTQTVTSNDGYSSSTVKFYDFFEDLYPLKNLKALSISYIDDYSLALFLTMSSDIQSLTLDQATPSILQAISSANSNIQKIVIKSMCSSGTLNHCPKYDFASLKNFSVLGVDNIKTWLKFVCSNPILESVELFSGDRMLTKPTIKALIDHPNLKHISFSGTLPRMKEVYDRMKVDYGRMKSMRLKVNEENCDLSFNFPMNGETWNPVCDLFDKIRVN